MNLMYWTLKVLTYIPVRIMYPTRIVGKKNFIRGKGIAVGNHRSNLDPVVLFTLFWRPMKWLAKKELMDKKTTNYVFRHLGCIPVNRQSVDMSTIKDSLKALKDNKTLVIFPEGRRSDEPFSADIKDGAAMFAVKTGAPIIPMYFQKKPALFRFNKLIIDEPIYIDESLVGNTSKENISYVSALIENKMLEMKKLYDKPPKKKKQKKEKNKNKNK